MKNIIILLAGLVLIACENADTDKSIITYSNDSSNYTNDFFELSVTKPESWYSQSPEDTMRMSQMGAGLMSGDDENMQAVFKESLKTLTPMFSFFESAPGTPVDFNPNVVSIAEYIGTAPGVKTGCDYLFHARKLLENSAMKVDVAEGCNEQTISGATLGYIDVTMSVNNTFIQQKYYACVKGEHVISIIQTFFDDESKAKVDQILNSVKIKCA